jgi:PTH1 family peptidyl-tRNA hydrolase
VNRKLIVGLGNPGREYDRTRHNVGFLAADALAARWGMSFARHRSRADVAEGVVDGVRVTLLKPQTFMNSSGDAVRPIMRLANLAPADVLVIYDEMDLPMGRLRLRDQGSAGGHRGMESIISQLGTNVVPRLRIGIGRPALETDPIDHVLATFTPTELAQLRAALDRVAEGVETFLRDGTTAAMNLINSAPKSTTAATAPGPEPSR